MLNSGKVKPIPESALLFNNQQIFKTMGLVVLRLSFNALSLYCENFSTAPLKVPGDIECSKILTERPWLSMAQCEIAVHRCYIKQTEDTYLWRCSVYNIFLHSYSIHVFLSKGKR